MESKLDLGDTHTHTHTILLYLYSHQSEPKPWLNAEESNHVAYMLRFMWFVISFMYLIDSLLFSLLDLFHLFMKNVHC